MYKPATIPITITLPEAAEYSIISLVSRPATFEKNKYINFIKQIILNLFIPVLPSFMTYHQVYTKSYTTCVVSRAGTTYPSGSPTFNRFLVGLLLFNN